MHEALDIYLKLIIAIISFIAPLIIHLLSVFSEGISIKRNRIQEYNKQAGLLLKQEINSIEGADVPALIERSTATFKKNKSVNAKELELLNPKVQVMSIFPIFFYSLIFMILNRVFSDDWYKDWVIKTYDNDVPYYFTLIILFFVSLWFAINGIRKLRNILWAIIDVKEEISLESQKEKQQLKTDSVSVEVEQEKK